jgi:membrane protein implicated in regulation of membrane protease activity
VLLVGAIVLAVLYLPPVWDVVVVSTAAVVEIAETAFWIRYSKRRTVRVGAETLIGARAEAVTDLLPEGQVRLGAELWLARCPAGARAGDRVRVRDREGLTLLVEPEP